MNNSPLLRLLWIGSVVAVTRAKQAFVLLGPTGDNALRPNGVFQGLYESWTAGVYNSNTVGIHPTMNTPHTVEELHGDFINSVTPLYEELQTKTMWECKQVDCSPETMWQDIEGNINIWDGRDANAQAQDMIPALEGYDIINVYLSIPPYAYADWAEAAATNWGSERTILAAEKPFGTSTEDAEQLYEGIVALIPEDNLKIVDHWLSFLMVKNLPKFQGFLKSKLGCEDWSKCFDKVEVIEHETRGLEGRGSFFDGVGQVRDLMQSHMLQTLSLSLIDCNRSDRSQAKLEILNQLSVKDNGCTHGQYDGWLFEPGLSYHADFADATYSTMRLKMLSEEWKNTEAVLTSGKKMGMDLYSIKMYQAGGPGVLTIDYGAEEVGLADISVSKWPLQDSNSFEAPKPGFDDDSTFTATPSVSAEGYGYILNYDTEELYIPQPYAIMLSRMFEADYGTAFVTYPETHQSWIVVTAGDDSECLDPPGDRVNVYNPPGDCGNVAPKVCYNGLTVQYYYDNTFSCTDAHDEEFADVDLYKDKCPPPPTSSPTEDDHPCGDGAKCHNHFNRNLRA